MARSVTGVYHRDSRSLGKYRWAAWEGVTLRACFNWALVCRASGGFIYIFWDLVRCEMGWTYGEVSLGFTLGDGAGTCWWIVLLGAGSHLAIFLGNLGSGWWVMAGFFSFLSSILIARLVWAGVGLGIRIAGSVLSLGVYQLIEASRRAAMDCRWASDWAVGAPVRASISVVSPWIMRYSGVTTGVVMVWWRNSTVSEIYLDLVSCGITRWHR